MVSIGIITAERSMEMVREVDPAMRAACEVAYLPYATTRQLALVYSRNAHRFDGILFSGAFPYEYVVSHVGPVLKPHAYFELADRDYYKLFARLLFQNPGLVVSRVVLDSLTVPIDFESVFGDDGPQFFDAVIGSGTGMDHAYEVTMEQAVRLWREGRIDRVVTRFTNLMNRFSAEGIPCELLFPSHASMLETFHSLLTKIHARILDDSMSAVGLVLPGDGDEKTREAVKAALAAFNEKTGMGLIVRESGRYFELITANDILRDLTGAYTHCTVSGHLADVLGLDVHIGWGLGRDVLQARQNAVRALRDSRRHPGRAAYLVNEEGEIVGPLRGGRAVTVAGEPDATTEKIGRRLGISSAHLQKLINLREKRGANRFTSAELAHYLNVTPRSASRILSRLAEFGGAQVVQTVQASPRGRPFKIYEVNVRSLDPDLATLGSAI